MLGTLLGHYHILEQIGQGSMGVVYRAKDTQLERVVAIKVLHTALSEDEDFHIRFQKEARSAANLTHPNIVTIHDAGRDSNISYIVMEIVEGESLRAILAREEKLSLMRALELAAQIGEGLDHAHRRKVIHGDIKPENLMVTIEGNLKITDFGLARQRTITSSIQEEEMAGTIAYLAPERIQGEIGDERSDLYAFGVVLYEMLAGHLPFSGESMHDLVRGHLVDQPPPLQSVLPDISAHVERIVLKLLEKKPEQRYHRATLLLKNLHHCQKEIEHGNTGEGSVVRDQIRLVGRSEELAFLQERVKQATSGSGSLVLLEGEAGIGKTRLLDELAIWLGEHRVGVHRVTCVEGEAPYHPFSQILMKVLEVDSGASFALRAERLENFLAQQEPESRKHLTGLRMLLLPEEEETRLPQKEENQRQLLFWSVWQFLADQSQGKPLVLMVDDLHAANAETMELLDVVVRQVDQAPILLIGTWRSESLLARDGWHPLKRWVKTWEQRAPECRRELHRLRFEETTELIAALLEEARVPVDIGERLHGETEGNPLFVVETLKWMQGQGWLERTSHGEWSFRYSTESKVPLPRSLQVVIHFQLERLLEEDLQLLRYAAIAGERFTSDTLVAVLKMGRQAVLQSLDRLAQRCRFLDCDGTIYRFTHARVREVLYENIVPELRRELHLLMGRYKEESYRNQIESGVFELAEHFYRAGESEEAFHYLCRAGDRARDMHAPRQAVDCYRRALELSTQPAMQRELCEKLGDECHAAGELERALEHYRSLLALHPEPLQQVETLRRMGLIYERMQKGQKALQHFEQALEKWNGRDLPSVLRARILIDLSFLYIGHFNDFGRAEELTRESGILLEGTENSLEHVHHQRNLGILCVQRGCSDEGWQHLLQRLKLAEELGDLHEIAHTCREMGEFDPEKSADKKAAKFLVRAVRLFRQVGDLRMVALTLCDIRSGDGQVATLEEALDISLRMGYVLPLGKGLYSIGKYYLQEAQPQKAWDLLSRGVESLLSLGFEGIYLTRCFVRALEQLQRAAEMMDRPEKFAHFFCRIREERPEEMEHCQPPQWALEPIDLPVDEGEQEVESWDGTGCPSEWTWQVNERDPNRYEPVFSSSGLDIRAYREKGHIIHNFEHNCDPPRLTRPLGGNFVVRVRVARGAPGCPKAGGLIAWKDARQYLLLCVDERDEVQLYSRIAEDFRMVGRGHLPGETHWMGLRREGSLLTALSSADGKHWWSAGQVVLEGSEELQVGIYPHPGELEIPVFARYGPFKIGRVCNQEESMTMREISQPSPVSCKLIGGEADGSLCALGRLSQVINGTLDLEELLERVLDVALDVIGAERGLVILTGEEEGQLQLAAARDIDGKTVEDATEISRRIISDVTGAGRPVLTLDAGVDGRFKIFDSVVLHQLRSILCLPLRMRGRIIGTLYLDHRGRSDIFHEDFLSLYEAMADQVATAVENARLYGRLLEENVYLRREVQDRYRFSQILGNSEPMQMVFARLEKIIESPVPVVISGESGTGKELIARAIHYEGARKEKRFVAENCAALPDQLLESELFGHSRGAFTGADRDRQGLFEVADGGTLFLDEIADASPALQVKLLRVLEEREIRRLGETEPRKVDVRLVVASSRNLQEEVDTGRFRPEFFYRLSVLDIYLPPLRERREDIPLLAHHFLQDYAASTGKELPGFSQEVLEALRRYAWPGNVRELRNEVERMAALTESGGVLSVQLLSDPLKKVQTIPVDMEEGQLKSAMQHFQKKLIENALGRCDGNRSQAARQLGISRSNLQQKMKRLGII
jgi:transcriptional regulator with GAF, ATPase, and Fis domain/tetratricopeptide (TPR) repeat protein